MYVLDGSGKEVYAKTPDIDHYSPKTFLISPDASVVMYSYQNRGGGRGEIFQRNEAA
jgi:hypothetical protein